MKKIICLFLIIMMCISCVACGDNGKKTYKIGVLLKDIDTDFSEVYATALSDLFTENEDSRIEYSVTILSSENSHARQLSQIEVYANQKYDVLIVECVDSSKALELVEAAVTFYEIEEEKEDNSEIDDESISDEENGNEENIIHVATDDPNAVNAESNPRVDDIYVPETVAVQIPIIFINSVPVLEEENTGNDENIVSDDREPIDTSLCSVVELDSESLTSNIEEMLKDLPLKGDKNGNGTVEYAFVCSDVINDDYKFLISNISDYFTQNNIVSSETFRYFAQTKDETFYKKTRENIEKNEGKLDIIFCLTDKALDAVYQLSIAPEVEPTEGSDETQATKIYTIGKDYNVITLGLEDSTQTFMENGVIEKYISYDYTEAVQCVVEFAINYLTREASDDDFVQENSCFEYYIVEKETSSN